MAGVAQHSDYKSDPWGRLQRTADFLAATTFGPADEAQKKVNAGEDFEKLASVYSTDNSKSNGGNVGWVLSTALIPQVSNVVVNLPKGVSTKQPIQTPNGWHIIKIVDKRPFQLPANLNQKEEKEKIAVLLKQQKRAEFIQSIRAARK
jgi:peptidyl-prolyl cis-trans isomerase C